MKEELETKEEKKPHTHTFTYYMHPKKTPNLGNNNPPTVTMQAKASFFIFQFSSRIVYASYFFF